MSKSASEILFETADAYQAQGVARGTLFNGERSCALGTVAVVVCGDAHQGYRINNGTYGEEVREAITALDQAATDSGYRQEDGYRVSGITDLNDNARTKDGRLLNVKSIAAVIRRAARTLKAQGR